MFSGSRTFSLEDSVDLSQSMSRKTFSTLDKVFGKAFDLSFSGSPKCKHNRRIVSMHLDRVDRVDG